MIVWIFQQFYEGDKDFYLCDFSLETERILSLIRAPRIALSYFLPFGFWQIFGLFLGGVFFLGLLVEALFPTSVFLVTGTSQFLRLICLYTSMKSSCYPLLKSFVSSRGTFPLSRQALSCYSLVRKVVGESISSWWISYSAWFSPSWSTHFFLKWRSDRWIMMVSLVSFPVLDNLWPYFILISIVLLLILPGRWYTIYKEPFHYPFHGS